jgi:hypothetical protein
MIAKQYLIPKAMEEIGFISEQFKREKETKRREKDAKEKREKAEEKEKTKDDSESKQQHQQKSPENTLLVVQKQDSADLKVQKEHLINLIESTPSNAAPSSSSNAVLLMSEGTGDGTIINPNEEKEKEKEKGEKEHLEDQISGSKPIESPSEPKAEERAASERIPHYLFADEILEHLIKSYCRESGVRSLEKAINKMIRKLAFDHVEKMENRSSIATTTAEASDEKEKVEGSEKKDQEKEVAISKEIVEKYLGKPIFEDNSMFADEVEEGAGGVEVGERRFPVGVVMGLSVSMFGGSPLYIETSAIPIQNGSFLLPFSSAFIVILTSFFFFSLSFFLSFSH